MPDASTRIGPLQIGVIVLALATALIHLVLGLQFGVPMFVLNALGYAVLLASLYAPAAGLANRRAWIRFALLGYTALTVALWVLFGERNAIGLVDKIIEAALIVLLVIEARRA
jgi:hypothetical protein